MVHQAADGQKHSMAPMLFGRRSQRRLRPGRLSPTVEQCRTLAGIFADNTLDRAVVINVPLEVARGRRQRTPLRI